MISRVSRVRSSTASERSSAFYNVFFYKEKYLTCFLGLSRNTAWKASTSSSLAWRARRIFPQEGPHKTRRYWQNLCARGSHTGRSKQQVNPSAARHEPVFNPGCQLWFHKRVYCGIFHGTGWWKDLNLSTEFILIVSVLHSISFIPTVTKTVKKRIKLIYTKVYNEFNYLMAKSDVDDIHREQIFFGCFWPRALPYQIFFSGKMSLLKQFQIGCISKGELRKQ